MASGIKYSKECKAEAVARVRAGESRKRIAEAIGISADTLSVWVRRADQEEISLDNVSESERNRVLAKENAHLRMEVDFLKKAAAYWAKESRS